MFSTFVEFAEFRSPSTKEFATGFGEVDFLQDTFSKSVIYKLKGQFAQHGVPDICISDNGPQFTSQEFKRSSKNGEFDHITPSPGFPQSSGKVEQGVKMAKSLMIEAKGVMLIHILQY